MSNSKIGRILIISGIAGLGILGIDLLWLPMEELKTTSTIITAVSLLIISVNNILQGLFTKE